jgi:TolB-like protein
MFRKTTILAVFLALAANTVFSQAVAIETALSNAVNEIAASVPKGTKIAVLNMSSDYGNLSDYIIDELIVNLVSTRSFQVVPRSTVELALARREFAFQMSGDVSDESQKRLGQFLGAGTIVSGSITRDSANSYRLVVNAIDLESFTYQTSYRISIQNNKKMKELVTAAGGGVFYEDYTTGQRLGMGALNMFFGIGSILQGQHLGWVTASGETLGIIFLSVGLLYNIPETPLQWGYESNASYQSRVASYEREKTEALERQSAWLTVGGITIGAAVVFGYIIPFFHHKPDTRVSQNNVPFNLELVSSNNQEINGFRISYNMRF